MERLEMLIKGGIAAGGGVIAYWLGGLDQLLITLMFLMVLDYITGVLKAIHNKCLSSEIGAKGIAKKVLKLCIVALAFVIEDLTSQSLPLREIVIMFFIANEGLSVLENYAATGMKVPEPLKKVLIQIQGEEKSE